MKDPNNPCLFCDIKKSGCAHENELAYASYDSYPVSEHHCLVIPKRHINNYFDLFNRVAANEIDLDIMENFLKVLKKIEDGEIDQHDGSVEIGKLLKTLYIDSALKRGDNLDKKYNAEKKEVPKQETKNISWKQYKQKYT